MRASTAWSCPARLQFVKKRWLLASIALCVGLPGNVAEAAPGELTIDTWERGTDNEFGIEFVTIGDPGNPPKTGTGWVPPAYDPGSVDYVFRISKYEISWGQARKAIAAGNLDTWPTKVGPAVDNPIIGTEDEYPVSNFWYRWPALFINWLNTSRGYHVAYNITGDKQRYFKEWPLEESWSATDRWRHKDCHYWQTTIDENCKAGMWDDVNHKWLDYFEGTGAPPTPVNGLFGGSTAPGTAVVSQGRDDRFPEYESAGNVVNVRLVTRNGAITGITYDSLVSGYSMNDTTITAFSVTQAGGSAGTATVPEYTTVRTPAQFVIVSAGSGYTGFPNLGSVWNETTRSYDKTYSVTLTLGTETIQAYVWTDASGGVLGVRPYAGTWTVVDTSTTVAIVQDGGIGGKARCIRYCDALVPTGFANIVGGRGYSDGPATMQLAAVDPFWWQSGVNSQPWQGMARAKYAGGLSAYGVMGLGGNGHDGGFSACDGNSGDPATETWKVVIGNLWNWPPNASGHHNECIPLFRNFTDDSDAPHEMALRVSSRSVNRSPKSTALTASRGAH